MIPALYVCVCLYLSQVVVVQKTLLFAWDTVSYPHTNL